LLKFFLYRKEISKLSTGEELESSENFDNLEEAREKIVGFLYRLKENVLKSFVIFFHWLLHFSVLFLRIISKMTDFLYSVSRDFFLKTATKEKGAVSVFWHHLKEYKKEKEVETKDL
jgi:hypothetical protein